MDIERSVNQELQTIGTLEEKRNKPCPQKEYLREFQKQKKGKALSIVAIMTEVLLLLAMLTAISVENLHYRSVKQLSSLLSGKSSFSSGVYTGDLDFGYMSGKGTFQFRSGTLYSGEWQNNEMDGIGCLNVPEEGTYEGSFIDSQKNGQGTFIWNDGTVYVGAWKNDQMDGRGEYVSSDGVHYSGVFKENRFWSGDCTFKNTTGDYTAKYKDNEIDSLSILFADGTTYQGESDGKVLCGTGIMVFPNGDTYSGNFENGKRAGEGSYQWQSGDQYIGAGDDDSMNGSGAYTYADGTCANGTFQNNHFIDGTYAMSDEFGDYTFQFQKGEVCSVDMLLSTGTTYSGEVSNGKLTGTATIHYSNGDRYSGRVEEGQKNGEGKYVWCSGASYEGSWKADKMDGQGTYFYPQKENGLKLVGAFQNGVPDGRCEYYESAGKSFKTDWSKGRCVKIYE